MPSLLLILCSSTYTLPLQRPAFVSADMQKMFTAVRLGDFCENVLFVYTKTRAM